MWWPSILSHKGIFWRDVLAWVHPMATSELLAHTESLYPEASCFLHSLAVFLQVALPSNTPSQCGFPGNLASDRCAHFGHEITEIPLIWAASPQACSWTETAPQYFACPVGSALGVLLEGAAVPSVKNKEASFRVIFVGGRSHSQLLCLAFCVFAHSSHSLFCMELRKLYSLPVFPLSTCCCRELPLWAYSLKEKDVEHADYTCRSSRNERHGRTMKDRRSHRVATALGNINRKWPNKLSAGRPEH